MKKQHPIGYILVLALLLMLLSGCGPLEQRLADGTAIAAGQDAGELLGDGEVLPPEGEGVGGGSDEDDDISPEEMATALALTLDAYNTKTPGGPTFTSTLAPDEGTFTPTFTPTATLDDGVTPTVPGYQFTALAQTLTSMVTTPGAGDETGTPTPTEEGGGADETEEPAEDTPTPEPIEPNACNSFRFVAHVTYPIGSVVEPETYFWKSWQVQNTGDCTWNSNYSLVYYDGFQLGGTSPLRFGGNVVVYPQQYVTVTIQLYTPPQPGVYTSYWLLQDDSGNLFGGGENGDELLPLEVYVPGQAAPQFTAPVSTAPPFTPAP
jgi:hypothetical protein